MDRSKQKRSRLERQVKFNQVLELLENPRFT